MDGDRPLLPRIERDGRRRGGVEGLDPLGDRNSAPVALPQGLGQAGAFEADDEAEAVMESAYNDFLNQFETSDGQSIKAGKESHEALEDEDVDQEQIVKQKRG